MSIEVDKLTDLPSVQRVIEELSADEISVNHRISELTSKRSELDVRVAQLSASFPDFEELESNAHKLSDMVGQTSELAVNLSGKIRQLDLVKSRVLDCVSKLDSIIKLKACSSEIEAALSQEKFEEAAGHINTFLNTDPSVLELAPKLTSDEIARASVGKLRANHEKLIQIVEQRFDRAMANHDKGTIDRFCKLFPLIGKHAEGLKHFGAYLCSLIVERCNGLFNMADLPDSDSGGKSTSCLDLMTQILEFIAELITEKQVYVETFYGPGSLYPITASVQSQCDIFVGRVVQRLRQQHALDELVKMAQISSYGQPSGRKQSTQAIGTSASALPGKDSASTEDAHYKRTLAIEPIVSDIVMLNTRIELYMRFVRRRVTADLRNASSSDAECDAKLRDVNTFFDNCLAVRHMQDLIGIYISLDSFYMCQMVIKACNSDEVNDSTKTLCFADDVFFLLKRSLGRSLSSGNIDAICAMLNKACSTLLDHLVSGPLTSRIRGGFPSGWMQDAYSYMQSSVAAVTPVVAASSVGTATGGSSSVTTAGPSSSGKMARHLFLVTLNTIELCLNNLDRIDEQFRQDLNALFNQSDSMASRKIQACLTDLKQAVRDKLNRLLDSGIEQLTTSVIRAQVKSVLQPFTSLQYDLSEDDLDLFAANDPWVQTCVAELDSFLLPFRNVLSSGNIDRLVSVLATELVRNLESQLRQKTFNRLGAIQFEKEVRCLFSYVTGVTYVPLRDHFTRILQMCSLLNLDKVDEVLFYWNNSTWLLVPNEVRLVLSLRKEFHPDEIRRLKL